MRNLKEQAKLLINEKLRFLASKGFSYSSVEENQYSFDAKLNADGFDIKLAVFFGKKGLKLKLQGNESTSAYRKVKNLILGDTLFQTAELNSPEPENYIGTDESGKGDYFGPLIIAGVVVNSGNISILKKIGVRDSKTLSQNQIKNIAERILDVLKHNYDVVFISPEKYNQLYERMKNVNRILGWAHARVIENVLEKNFVEEVISDKFGNEKIIIGNLLEKGKKIKLRQETGAEKYTAVAAASIIARYRLNQWFERTSHSLDVNIPKGGGGKADDTARLLLRKIGKEELTKLVKLHFRNSKRIFD